MSQEDFYDYKFDRESREWEEVSWEPEPVELDWFGEKMQFALGHLGSIYLDTNIIKHDRSTHAWKTDAAALDVIVIGHEGQNITQEDVLKCIQAMQAPVFVKHLSNGGYFFHGISLDGENRYSITW